MDNLVQRIEAIPLDGSDLVTMATKMGNPKTTWMLFSGLEKFETIDQVFGLQRASGAHMFNTVFVLIGIENAAGMNQTGHWITLSFDAKLQFQYYDPYALTINQDLVASGTMTDVFSRLLNGQNVNVNQHQHQKFKEALQNCGRHTAVRSVFHFMNNDQYNALVIAPIVKHNVSDADTFVSIMTAFLAKTDDVIRMMFQKQVGFNMMARNIPSIGQSLPQKNIGLGGRVV